MAALCRRRRAAAGGLKERCLEEGIASQVDFVGRRSSQEIPQWMQAADVLVLPSHSEGRPNVVLEAQACGLPVVATRVGGTPELIREWGNRPARRTRCGGPAARGVGDAPERRPASKGEMGEQARALIEKGEHSWEHSAATLHALYRSVLEEA